MMFLINFRLILMNCMFQIIYFFIKYYLCIVLLEVNESNGCVNNTPIQFDTQQTHFMTPNTLIFACTDIIQNLVEPLKFTKATHFFCFFCANKQTNKQIDWYCVHVSLLQWIQVTWIGLKCWKSILALSLWQQCRIDMRFCSIVLNLFVFILVLIVFLFTTTIGGLRAYVS